MRYHKKQKRDTHQQEKIMRLHHSICILFLLIFIYAITPTFCKQKNTTPANMDKKYAVLFELINVLIKENQTDFAKQVGYGLLARYALTHWKHPGHRCLDMLAAMSTYDIQKPHVTITINKRILPRCLVELQEGTKTSSQAKTEIMKGIEYLDSKKFFSGIKEKNLMITIMNLALNPETTASIIEPAKATIQLAQKLKDSGHSIYIFANAPEELLTILEKKHPELLELFDGIVISSHVKEVKPGHAMFNHVIQTHNLNPHDCILIDSQERNIAVAQEFGMQAIMFDKISHVTSQLKKWGVKL